MSESASEFWTWRSHRIRWSVAGNQDNSELCVLLIHGFGANTLHWRFNQPLLGGTTAAFAIDLLGFGSSDQPRAVLAGESSDTGTKYSFDLWAEQVADFCREVISKPVLLVGNSIGGVVALRSAQLLELRAGASPCKGIVLIDCAQRLMDDKQLVRQPAWMSWLRPALKVLVQQRWLSSALFRNAARPTVIRNVLKQAYPSGKNLDNQLVDLLYQPSRRQGSAEAFRGFINLFDDHLAPDLMQNLTTPVDLIWGEQDPWEPVEEARRWLKTIPCVKTLEVISGAGHCPHDETPEPVNTLLLERIKRLQLTLRNVE
uniref:alpha/beta fold hydrolase n=1 Tax=Synechococcus sp. UW106 TaxID=368495 RepID=UPI000E0E560C|nr:alpha/beta fold hydrolase [Synechococcus sp. UW106]